MDEATRAFLRADYADAILRLESESNFASRILLAQSFLRAGRPAAAEVTAREAALIAQEPDEYTRASSILALTLVRRGNVPAARSTLKSTDTATSEIGKADLAYAKAFVAFAADDIDSVEVLAADALRSSDVNARIRARNLVSFVYGRRSEAQRHASLLLDSFEECGTDVYLRASTIYQLSIIARETAIDVAVAKLSRAVASLAYTDPLAVWRYISTQNIAWHHAINGSYEDAYRFAEDAIALAPSLAWAVSAHADYAQFAVAAGEKTCGAVQLGRALEKAARVDWSACEGEERYALLDLAVLLSKRDQVSAKRFLQQFDDLPGLLSMLVFARDDRAKAMRGFAGAMQVGVPEAHAVRDLRDAHRTFIGYNYQWRAAAAASALAEVTKKAEWIDVARLHLRDFPKSWLSQAIVDRDIDSNDRYRVLSPQQRRVFKLILEGLSDREIAARLGLTHKTARNYVGAVLERLGVHSRRTLIAEYNRQAS